MNVMIVFWGELRLRCAPRWKEARGYFWGAYRACYRRVKHEYEALHLFSVPLSDFRKYSVASDWVATPGGYRLGAASSPLGTAPSYGSGGTPVAGQVRRVLIVKKM